MITLTVAEGLENGSLKNVVERKNVAICLTDNVATNNKSFKMVKLFDQEIIFIKM